MICGPPGSGKTTLIRSLLEGELFQQYNYVFLFAPTNIYEREDGTRWGRFFPGENWFYNPDLIIIEEIFDWVLTQCPNASVTQPVKVMFIIDDSSASIRKHSNEWTQLVTNRRHTRRNRVKLAIIISCHRPKGSIVPTLRLMADSIILFRPDEMIREVFTELGIHNGVHLAKLARQDHQFLQINRDKGLITLGWDTPLEKILR